MPTLPEAGTGVPAVYQAIADVSAAIAREGIAKDRRNEQQGYRFRGIDDVYNALAPILAKNGLVILPKVFARDQVERQTQKGGTLFYTTVGVEFAFVSTKDGSQHIVTVYGEAMDSGDKSTNKAMSAAYKYAAMQTFCIPTEGDHDSETTTVDPIVPRAGQMPQATAGSQPPRATAQPPMNGPKPVVVPMPPPQAVKMPEVVAGTVSQASEPVTVKMQTPKKGDDWVLYPASFTPKVKATDGKLVGSAATYKQELADQLMTAEASGRKVLVTVTPHATKRGLYEITRVDNPAVQ